MAGCFILQSWVRQMIGMDNDALDFEILNYLGVENLEESTITNYPNLQNCLARSASTNQFETNYLVRSFNKLGQYFVSESLMFITTRVAMHIIKIQMIYHDNIHQALVQNGRVSSIIKRLKQKPTLYRVYKIYHKYMIGSKTSKKNKHIQLLDNIFTVLARIYTTLLYAFILFFTLGDKKICIFVFVYLIYFFIYFIRINKTFLGYMIREDIEKIIDLKLDYFYEKYLSKFALKN